jgi:thiol-disulfide isomerase/thioredoxin
MTRQHILVFLTVALICVSPLMAFVNQPAHHAKRATSGPTSSRKLYIDPDMTGTIGPGQAATAGVASPARRRRTKAPQKKFLHKVSNPEEFEKEVLSEDDKLVVVRFVAPYCKACKSIQVAYERLASSLQKTVKFVDVSIEDREEFPELHVPATPYAQIYHPELGLVEHSPIARRQLTTFKKVLKWYVDGVADLDEDFFSNPQYEPPRMVGVTP